MVRLIRNGNAQQDARSSVNDIMLHNQTPIDPMLAHAGAKRSMTGSPRDVLFTVFWHRRKVVGFFIAMVFLTALAVLIIPSTYRSEASLLMKLGSEITPDPISGIGNNTVIQPVVYREMQMKTELEVLKSKLIARAVVDEIGAGRVLRKSTPMKDLPTDSPLYIQALLAIDQNLKLEVIPESTILSVAYECGDSMLARDIVNTYVHKYLDHRSEVYANRGSAEFLGHESTDVRSKLSVLMDEIKLLKQKAGIADTDEERKIVQTRIGDLNKQISDARTELAIANSEVETLGIQLKTIPETQVATSTINDSMSAGEELKKNIVKLQQQLAEARARFVPGSQQIVNLEAQIEELQKIVKSNSANDQNQQVVARNPAYDEIQKRLLTSTSNQAIVKSKITALESEVKLAQTKSREIDDLDQLIRGKLVVVGATEEQLRAIETAHGRASLLSNTSDLKLNQITINQPATLPLKAVAPNRLMLLVLGMFVAATGAIGLGLVSEAMSRTTKRPEDVGRISELPSVSVPVVDSHGYLGNGATNGNGQGLISRLLGTNKEPELSPRPVGGQRSPQVALPGSVSAQSTQQRGSTDVRPMRRWSPQLLQAAQGIIDGLLFDAIQDHKHEKSFVTGLISCRPGQGASTLAPYVATAIADRLEASIPIHPDDRVLLIDADLDEPTQHRNLAMSDSPGLGDWLAKLDTPAAISDFSAPSSHSRMSFMPAGKTATMMRLLDRMDLLIASVGMQYRHVVIDLPPVSTSPTALRLAAKCDAVLLVVECGGLHQEVVRRSVQALRNVGANVVGVVLNKRRFPIPDWLYERA